MRPLALTLALLVGACAKTAEPPATLPARAADPATLAGWPALLAELQGQALDGAGKVTAAGVPLFDLRAKGRPTIYAFWASYCPPCLAEMPMFQALHDDGVAVVGVSLDGDDVAGSAKLMAEHGARYPNVVLDTPSMKRAGKALAAGLPFTLVVDGQGAPRVGLSAKCERPLLEAALAAARAPP
ncbi:MAG: TlpA family protein disulfide reductase [Myxococcales bacterium]|nr:TlpA family protein disulfide reductase [Myxococcales bacterium]MCB9648886.1 TlpA family protein disulfide reductase [Deltaproteobacteria bacterium]